MTQSLLPARASLDLFSLPSRHPRFRRREQRRRRGGGIVGELGGGRSMRGERHGSVIAQMAFGSA